MFDRSLLPPAHMEFVVIADTHFMLDPGDSTVEFASRRLQSARAGRALGLAASLHPEFVVHMGDLVQEFPERPDFDRAVTAALTQLKGCGIHPKHVAGNHDVGDKPDPTMPTEWVTARSLAAYHARLGCSWYSWDHAGIHFVILNSQIMNSDLPEAEEQRRWFETDLRHHIDRRTFVFLHLPPYVMEPGEPHLGHYDNIGETDRSWYLELLQRYGVELLFAGHVHFAFYNHWGGTRYFVAPSPAFTRPGFSELFSSGPPPEQGRDDAAKLGFFLVRVHDQDSRVHFLRTGGDGSALRPHIEAVSLVTGTPADLPRSALGIGLRHPLAHAAQVPLTWPSAIRQSVRNDYPLLACLELGIRFVRVPIADLADPLQRERLALLRAEGVQVIATILWTQPGEIENVAHRHVTQMDGLELQVVAAQWPPHSCLTEIRTCRTELGLPITLTTLSPDRPVAGKQHSRSRLGYHLDEALALDRYLDRHGAEVDAVLCRPNNPGGLWHVLHDPPHLPNLGRLDWLVEMEGTDQGRQLRRLAELTFTISLFSTGRIFVEPLIDLDRTMDVAHGLLDRLCNPRTSFHLLRCLNTLLYAAPAVRRPLRVVERDGGRWMGAHDGDGTRWLLLPPAASAPLTLSLSPIPELAACSGIRCYHLSWGTVESLSGPDHDLHLTGPDDVVLLVGRPDKKSEV